MLAAVNSGKNRCKEGVKALTSVCHAMGTVRHLSACQSAAMDPVAPVKAASQSKACWCPEPNSLECAL